MNKENLLKLTKNELIELIERIYRFSESEIWEYHKFHLSEPFGMNLEQLGKMNEFVKDVHNTAYNEIMKTIDSYISNKL